jgi:hypothetical protein
MRLVSLVLLLSPLIGLSQQKDTTLNTVLTHGKFSVHARTFFMATVNDGDLTDYYALGVGAGIGYESPELKNFKIGVSGFFIYNAMSNDLSKPDPLSNTLNRYEIGLFDLTDPKNRKDLDRLEELYVQYRIHKSFVRAGKLILNTPFINPQDGRMRPTLEQGLWTDVNEIKNTTLHAGWITQISPRSTVRWYDVDESIGIYPVGLNELGTRSDYAGNLRSKGIGLIGFDFKNNAIRISGWNTFVENISNTAFIQAEKALSVKNHFYYGGIQYVRQDAIASGGNEMQAQTYITPGTYSNMISGRLGLRNKQIDANINGTFFSSAGRFLMPREWGRDPFYTFLPRERNEGFGDVKAFSANLGYTHPAKQIKIAFGVGHYELPDVGEFALNKYAMPSYAQFNSEVRYSFIGFLEGTSLQFLYVYKKGTGKDYENVKNVMNKVDMSNFNVVINYRFESPQATPKK